MRSLGCLLALLSLGLAGAGQAPATEAPGTVNEVMIGIIDPNTNTVGYAAFLDPDAPSDSAAADQYAGWERVRSAAIAMAESASLLMMSGRLCSNGMPAPVDQEDWIAWSMELGEAGLAGYAAAKRESMDALLELGEQLTASCVSCHMRYVDVGGDPENRCMP